MARSSRPLRIAALALALTLLGVTDASALRLEQVAGGFAQPSYVASDPGDANRLLITERKGTIQLLANGAKSKFADLTGVVGCGADCAGERGLLSIALSPDFDQSGRLFAAYADDVDGTIHVDELVSPGPGHTTATRVRELLAVPHPGPSNHNGGQIQFGPDGFLYLSTGDGGGSDDELHNAQDPGSPLGKILRLDPNAASPGAYELWSLGLRNPYRFSFDRQSGDLVIGDVGQKLREEVDFAPSPFPGVVGGKGANYGWNCEEGLIPGPGTDPECAALPADATILPAFDYPHDPDPDLGGAARCSIIGGYVVRDPGLGALAGHYVYTDYCGGALRSLRLPTAIQQPASGDCSLGLSADNPVSFGEDAAGRIYLVEEGGELLRLAGSPPAGCPAPPAPESPLGPPLPPANGSGAQPGPAAALRTSISIKAERRRVERGKRAALTVRVRPCRDRPGTTVRLLRDGRPSGERRLNRACTAHFSPRIRAAVAFSAATRAERGYRAATSPRLRIWLRPASAFRLPW